MTKPEMSGAQFSQSETLSPAVDEITNYNSWLEASLKSHISGDVLEIGIGLSHRESFFEPATSYVGIDINEAYIERARAGGSERAYYVMDIGNESPVPLLGEQTRDTIFSANVLEHIEDDHAALRELLKLLRPNGTLILFVPAFNMIYNHLDTLAGHYRRYDKQMIRALFHDKNAEIVRLEYFNPIGFFAWAAQKFSKPQSLTDDALMSKIYFFDKYIVPISKFFNPLTKSFIGQSIIVVARKAGQDQG